MNSPLAKVANPDFRCPKCSGTDGILVLAEIWVTLLIATEKLVADGFAERVGEHWGEDPDGGFELEPHAQAHCACGYMGQLHEFDHRKPGDTP